MRTQKFGRQTPATYNTTQLHDFIHVTLNEFSRIIEICRPLYEQGHSLSEISRMTGFPLSTIRYQLKFYGVILRTKGSVRHHDRSGFKSSSAPPFGFTYLEGRLQKDPREFPTLQIIQKQLELGQSVTQITDYLNALKLKSRHLKPWRRQSVFNIMERLKLERISTN